MTRFHLGLFGPPELRDGPRRVPFRTQKHVGLLVYLALEARERGVERERLVDLLWADAPLVRGRHSLSQGLTAIRERLGSTAVPSGGRIVRLIDPPTTDLDRLPDLPFDFANGTGLAEPLHGLDTCGGAGFAHWVDATRARILRATREALLADIRELRGQGDVRRVHERAQQLYRVDPESDAAACTLAEMALLEGDTVGAARLLRDHLERTAEIQGERRGGDVARLLHRIESCTPPLARSAQPEKGAAAPQTTDLFVGRRAELGRLEALWAAAGSGTVQSCLVTGPAGIGKSVLVRRFATSVAARGSPVLMATCQEVGSGIPLATLADLIDGLRTDPALGGTDPDWLAEASRVVPALKAQFPGIPDPPAAPGEAARLRVAEAFYRMIESVADGGATLVVVDDFQHIDPASREVLHILSRRMVQDAALILAAERTDDLEPTGPPLHPGEASTEWQHTLRVGPLLPGESLALITNLTGDPQPGHVRQTVTAKIDELAAGNPYFIEMLVADWKAHAAESLAASAAQGDATSARWQPPATMRVAFSRHYEGITEDARHALGFLAVAGRAMDADEVGHLLGASAAQANRSLLEAVGTGILRMEGGAVSFKNELHRAFVYYAMPDAARRYHHVRLARSLAAAASGGNAQHFLEASHHFARAGMPDDSLEAAIGGARLALAQGASREAENALLAAVKGAETAPPVDALLLLAEALNQQGNYAQALVWLRGLNDRQITERQQAAATGLTAEALVRARLAHRTEIHRMAELNLRQSRECGDEFLLIRALQISAELAADSTDWQTLSNIKREAEKLADSSAANAVQAHGELTLGFSLLSSGRFASAYRRFVKSVALLEQGAPHATLSRALNGCGMCAFSVGEFALAVDAYERALELAEEAGDHALASNIAGNMGVLFTDLGLWEEAQKQFERTIHFVDISSDIRSTASAHINIADFKTIRGDWAGAREALRIAEAAVRQSELPSHLIFLLTIQADGCLAQGRRQEALRFVDQAHEVVSIEHLDSSEPALTTPNMMRWALYKSWLLGRLDRQALEAADPRLHRRGFTLSASVELAVLTEWLAEQLGCSMSTQPSATQMIRATGFQGIEQRMKRLGLFPARG